MSQAARLTLLSAAPYHQVRVEAVMSRPVPAEQRLAV
jgi:hypothetical protein